MIQASDIRKVFDKYDADESGQLEASECIKCINDLGIDVTDETEFRRFWEDADTNGDYKISFIEFLSWVRVGRHSGLVDVMKKHVKMINRMEAIQETLQGLEKIVPDEVDVDNGEVEKIIDF